MEDQSNGYKDVTYCKRPGGGGKGASVGSNEDGCAFQANGQRPDYDLRALHFCDMSCHVRGKGGRVMLDINCRYVSM